MNNIITESQQKQKQKKEYIPAISLLLALPASIAASYFVQGESSDFATLNQKAITLFIPTAYADTINFSGDNNWTNQDGSYSLTDHSNHSNHSNHSSGDGGGDGGSDGGSDDDSDDSC